MDDIALLESDTNRAQEQLDALKRNAAKVGLEIIIKKDCTNVSQPTKRTKPDYKRPKHCCGFGIQIWDSLKRHQSKNWAGMDSLRLA